MNTTFTTQVELPGQCCVAEGPIDHTGMYVMHHAIRRDLANLVAATAQTPPGDRTTWENLAHYWQLFAELLHHHHTAEDDHYWPVLADAANRRGTESDRSVVAAMAAEHGAIDPVLAACRAGFQDVQVQPSRERVDVLHQRLEVARRVISDHMAHEERDALTLVQRVVSPQEYAQIERGIGKSYPLRVVRTLVPWAFHGLPGTVGDDLLAKAGLPERMLLRLGRRSFERRHAAAFRYVSDC
jgi:hemerythrin-like domain-containing protein